jgi:hypothetical protein
VLNGKVMWKHSIQLGSSDPFGDPNSASDNPDSALDNPISAPKEPLLGTPDKGSSPCSPNRYI